MGRRTRRRRSMRHERKIEHRQWITNSGMGGHNVTLKAGIDSNNLIKLATDPLKGDDQTILRTRGFVNAYYSTLGTPCIGVLGGLVLPNKTASNASVSDLPHPLVDEDTTDWFVWQPFAFGASIGTGTEETEDIYLAQTLEMPIDSKAKRIMEASESVVWILGLHPEAAVSNKQIDFAWVVRTLVGY